MKTKRKALPIFEASIAVFSLYSAVILFLLPDLLHEAEMGVFYRMGRLAPQGVWAFSFFIAGLIKAIGLLLKKVNMRRLGLLCTACLYGTISICYAYGFPNLGTGLFAVLTLMALVTLIDTNGSEL